MSRSQATDIYNTAKSEQGTNFNEAQQSEKNAQADIGQYQSALAKYAASNPYVQGGEYQTSQNQTLANTADAGANAAKATLQQQAERTGQNPAAANATAEEIVQQGQRTLGAQQAQANQNRIGSEATYNTDVLNASSKPEAMQEQLAALQSGASSSDLSEENQASAQNKSFGDEFGGAFAGALGSGLGQLATFGAGKGVTKIPGVCHVAAELYGGWDDPRTTLVRRWIFGPFAEESWKGLVLSSFYARFSERLAALVRRSRIARSIAQRLFDAALRRAHQWQDSKA